MRAASRSISQFLGSQRSLHDTLPAELRELLTTTLVLFAAQHDETVYRRLSQQASAFDADGNPAVKMVQKPPGRIALLTGRALEGISKMSLTITSRTALITIPVMVIVVLRHLLPIVQLLQYLW